MKLLFDIFSSLFFFFYYFAYFFCLFVTLLLPYMLYRGGGFASLPEVIGSTAVPYLHPNPNPNPNSPCCSRVTRQCHPYLPFFLFFPSHRLFRLRRLRYLTFATSIYSSLSTPHLTGIPSENKTKSKISEARKQENPKEDLTLS